MTRRLALILTGLLLAFPLLAAEPFNLSPQYRAALFRGRDHVIDPDVGLYGVNFGATEPQVLEALGEPNGVIVLTERKRAYLYGSSHLLLFRNGRLEEVRISDHVFDWELSQQMDGHPFFDLGSWVVKPGLRKGISFAEARKLLGRPESKPDYRMSYDTEAAVVTLGFHSRSGPGSEDGFFLATLAIRHYGR